ncbi:helix-turn-helix transcriptional regulator [Leifsonia shinshuensis]|uniref:HTH luxR-type domain-containing protein n=1 Tax=Leifsonia shinshuensis TaxID=150026 RepID=A0A7G6Y744_9MICO|nr:LuxR family transcriptional regulator [Leifsonia shinshuensis]QNE34309.1 hypothetical protein F1C12_03580 [Leifsonia shinshuensis]
MLFARAAELRHSLDYLLAGTSVRLVALPTAGRTTFTRHAIEALDECGYETIVAPGFKHLAARPFESLEATGLLAKSAKPPSVSGVADLLGEYLAARRGVIVVDDAPSIDVQSAAALGAVSARLGVPVLATASTADADSARAFDQLLPMGSAAVDLAPVTFDVVSDIAHEMLGGAVDAWLVGRLYAKSAGRPGLVGAMIRIGAANGTILRHDGLWSAGAEIWHPAMGAVVDRLLYGCTDEQREALEAMSLTSPLDLRAATALFGHRVIEDLEARGLVQSIGPLGRSTVVVSPALVAKHFQQQPATSRHARILDRVRAELAALEPGSGPAAHELDRLIARRAHAGGGAASEPALIRMLHESRDARVSATKHEWLRHGTVESANAYLEALFAGDRDPRDIEDVFAETSEHGADAAVVARHRVHRARWLAFGVGDLTGATGLLRESVPGLERFGALLEAAATALELQLDGVPGDIADRFAGYDPDEQADWAAADVARATALVLAAQPVRALGVLNAVRAEPSSAVAGAHAAVRAWALLLAGECVDAVLCTTEQRELARTELDIERYREHTYIAAVASVPLGRYAEAERLLGTVLALGTPGLGQEQLYFGALALSSLLAVRGGRLQTAGSLARQTSAPGHVPGPWPGMLAALPEAALLAMDGDDVGAANALAAGVLAASARGYTSTAATHAVIDFAALGRDVAPLVGDSVRLDVEGSLVAPYRALQASLDAGDAPALVGLGEWFLAKERIEQAAVALTAAERLLAEDGTEEGARVRRLQRTARTLLDAADPGTRAWEASHAQLTGREVQIARLVGNGLSNPDIAARLGISPRTVESHVLKVFRKLGVSARAELAKLDWF